MNPKPRNFTSKAMPICESVGDGAYLWITVGVEVEINGEGHCAIDFAEAAAHVLLKALHMHSQ